MCLLHCPHLLELFPLEDHRSSSLSDNEICMGVISFSLWPHQWAQEWASAVERANEIFTEASCKERERISVVKGKIVAATLSMRRDDREEPCWQCLNLWIKDKVSPNSEFFSYVNL